MNVNLMPYAVIWGALALVVVALIVYRKYVADQEDDSIHLEGSASTDQIALAHRLAVIDRWGKAITALVVVFGLALAAVYVYQLWTNVPSY
jgi:hypothetical protein